MLTITKKLDISPRSVPHSAPQVINLSQYDSDFEIQFKLYASTGTFTIEEGTTAAIKGTKPSGTGYSADASIDIETKTVTVSGDVQMTAAAGRCIYEIALYKDNKEINSANFILLVERAALDADTITDESVLRNLEAIVEGAETATQAADDAVDAKTAAEAAQQAAEAAAEQAEGAIEVDDTLSVEGRPADAAETGKIRDAVFDYVELDKSDYLYNLQKMATDGSTSEQSDGTRIRIIYKTEHPTDVSIECDYGDGVAVSLYDTAISAVGASRSYSETISYDYTHFASGRFTAGGYISVSQKKSDGSIFTPEERAAAFDALNVSIKYISGTVAEKIDRRVEKIERAINQEAATGIKELYIGELVNGHLTAGGTVDDSYTNYRVSTKEVVAFPCASKRRLKVNISPDYLFAIRTGAKGDNLSENYNWYKNGDVIDLADSDNYYGISICHSSGNAQHMAKPVCPSDDFQLSIEYIGPTPSTVEGNSEAIKKLSSARLFFSSSERNTLEKYAVIAHTSDCHGDYKRVTNFLDFCDYSGVDAACITGDIVAYDPKQGIKWFNDLLNAHDVLPAVCAGNHDVYDSAMTDDDIYDYMFADVAEKIGNTTEKTWYYIDIDSKKLRIISVNLYQYGGTNRWYTHFTEEQLEWLVDTLSDTPIGYGIIILTHAPQVEMSKSADYPTFYQDTRLYNGLHNSVSGGVPVYDIVDAFISRGTLSKTYTQTGSPDSISVSADFSNVDTSVEFIAHLTGHFHQDTIAYIPGTTNKQLMLNVTCTIATFGGSVYPYLADIQDIGRNILDVTQDAFNVYVVDRDNKAVKVIRVGSDMTVDMQERKYMVIPYAD